MNNLRNSNWSICNQNPQFDELDIPIEPMFAVTNWQVDDLSNVGAYIPGYCEECEEAGAGGETLVSFASIEDPAERTASAHCMRCNYEDATPDYDATESRSKCALGVAVALFPESFAADYCRWCSEGEYCPR